MQLVPSLALHDTMKHVQSQVATVGFGACMGMPGFLLATGAKVSPPLISPFLFAIESVLQNAFESVLQNAFGQLPAITRCKCVQNPCSSFFNRVPVDCWNAVCLGIDTIGPHCAGIERLKMVCRQLLFAGPGHFQRLIHFQQACPFKRLPCRANDMLFQIHALCCITPVAGRVARPLTCTMKPGSSCASEHMSTKC